MSTFHLNKLPKSKRIQMIGEFYDMINSLKNREEVRLFIKSLLTADEIANLMRRIEIAVLLSSGFKYDEIIENRKSRLRKIKKLQREKESLSPLSAIKRKYPGHFLLTDLLDAAVERLGEDEKELEKEAVLFTPSSK